ncbi:hypothetical protein AMAG_15338 [Allomyces macrogynus ATCC 38327]|uniref:J domain-containing protein n=1 Tax=Allomyces macrogynus (strain ATCC 38327) TaxID=578462 RepID=A0A0L0T8F1_ALLM3|nr:hypothetical protein AMAG_15338 [Allomyces macrogynus ATCC 38327]|eukprot:KNE71088.1 hypothetical protein AMAG_15338 [Allomyces macrogynus ATCC 38327]
MALRYESSSAEAYYVVLTFLVLLVVPATWLVFLRAPSSDSSTAAAAPSERALDGNDKNAAQCTCSACTAQRAARAPHTKVAATGTRRRLIIRALVILGWIALAYTAYQVATSAPSVQLFDPHATLGVAEGADRATVRKAYRQLSLTEHPDKVPASQRKQAEARFVEIAKAYKVLTDAKARENFEKYGNPDGPMGMSFGIGLPSWMMQTNVVVMGYLGLLVLVPAAFASWWYGSRKYAADGILKSSIDRIQADSPSATTTTALISLIATSHSDPAVLTDTEAASLRPLLPSTVPTSASPNELALYAHLYRVLPRPLPDFIRACGQLADLAVGCRRAARPLGRRRARTEPRARRGDCGAALGERQGPNARAHAAATPARGCQGREGGERQVRQVGQLGRWVRGDPARDPRRDPRADRDLDRGAGGRTARGGARVPNGFGDGSVRGRLETRRPAARRVQGHCRARDRCDRDRGRYFCVVG